MPESLQDDIRAAIESASAAETPPGQSPEPLGAPASEVLPPVEPDNKEPQLPKPPVADKTPTPPRGPDGKFLPQKTEAVSPSTPAQPIIPASPEDLVHFDPAKPPAAWTQPMKDKWNTIPEDIRVEITRREEATASGVQKLMQHYEPMEQIFNVIAPHEQYFQQIRENPQEYLSDMITMEQILRTGNPAQKVEMLLAMGDVYGVPIRSALDSAMDGKLNEMMQQAHQHHKTPPQVPMEIQRELQEQRAWRSQVEDMAAESELSTFAQQQGHEYLEYVREDMADIIERGIADSYQDAYDLACWRNPQIRQAIIGQQNGQLNSVQQRQQAAAAIVAPGQAPLVEGGDENKPDDDIHETVRKAWNQAATGRA
jgi:Predicted membrane protein